MFQHILVPVEISDAKAYSRAVNAASKLLSDGGKITLLHAIEPVPAYVETYIPPDVQMSSQKEVKSELDEMAKMLGIKNIELVVGSAGRSVVDWADENSADCIVIKSHKPGFSDIFLGSTAAWVVRHAKTNVLVLR